MSGEELQRWKLMELLRVRYSQVLSLPPGNSSLKGSLSSLVDDLSSFLPLVLEERFDVSALRLIAVKPMDDLSRELFTALSAQDMWAEAFEVELPPPGLPSYKRVISELKSLRYRDGWANVILAPAKADHRWVISRGLREASTFLMVTAQPLQLSKRDRVKLTWRLRRVKPDVIVAEMGGVILTWSWIPLEDDLELTLER